MKNIFNANAFERNVSTRGKKQQMMRRICSLAVLMLFSLAMGLTVWASDISSIRLTVTDTTDRPGEMWEPAVTTGSSEYEVSNVEWEKEVSKWTPGKKVKATVTIVPTGSRTFASSIGKQNLSVSNGEKISCSTLGEEEVRVRFYYIPVVKLDTPYQMGWSDSTKTKASWSKVKYATCYYIKLYAGNDDLVRTETVTGTSVDLSAYMKKEAAYYYEIQARGKDSAERKYLLDGEEGTSDDSVLTDLGDTTGAWQTYKDGKKYRQEDGTYPSNGWMQILGKWYYFNQDSYVATGWKEDGGKKYFMNSDGLMMTGWLQLDGKWYLFGSDGDMQTGWAEAKPGEWYYLGPDGAMMSNATVDGYQLDVTGKRIQ